MKYSFLLLVAVVAIPLCSCSQRNKNPDVDNADDMENLSGSIEVSSENTKTQSQKRIVWPPSSSEIAKDLQMQNYLVVLDDSGSMRGKRFKQAQSALRTLADTLPKEHNLGLILLNNKEYVTLDIANRDTFKRLVRSVSAGGGTPLKESTRKGFKLITQQASKQKGYGDYHMIIVTDGESNDGSPLGMVKSIVRKTAVQVHVVGFHLNNHELNDPSFVDYQTANNTADLIKAFESVAAETSHFTDPQEFSN